MVTRRERVVLELEDDFTTGMARAAAAAALLNRELDSLSRDAVRTRRGLSDIDQPMQRVGRSANSSSREVDKLSGRMRILADVAAILGPSLVPIGAVGIPAITGLAAQLGFAAVAGGTAIIAFQGVGDTLKALNAAALEPTQANLEKAQIALEKLSPAARGFVAEIGEMLPELRRLRDTAAEGLFPGLTEGLDALESGLPRVRNVLDAVSTTLGDIAADTGRSLASDRWLPFLDFIAAEAPDALRDMASAAGNTAHAVAALWMATTPLNQDFSDWLVDATASIDRWATGLGKTQGFADFLSYVEETGPKVADAFGAIANAVVQILQAAAPLGGPVLQGIEALANVVAAIASSDLGTPLFTAVAALALFNRTLALTKVAGGTALGGFIASQVRASAGVRTLVADLRILQRESRLVTLPGKNFIGPLTQAQAAATRLKTTLPSLAKTSALVAGIGIAGTGAADGIGLTNTASLALMGTLAGPWGAAIGGAIGATLDLSNASDDLETSLSRVNAAARSGDFSTYEAEANSLEKKLKDLQEFSGVGDAISDGLTRASQAIKHPKDFISFGQTSTELRIADALTKARIDAEASRTRAAQALLRDGFIATAEGAEQAATSTQDFRRELEDLNAALSGRASLRDYEEAIDDFAERAQKRAELLGEVAQAQKDLASAKTPEEKKSARERIRDLKEQADALVYSLDISTKAGRETQELLDGIVQKGLKFAESIADPVKRTEFLAGVRTEFLKAAEAAGMSTAEAEKLAKELLGINAIKSRVKIVIDADGAWRVIDQTAARLERLTRPIRRINITAQATNVQAALADIRGESEGGTIPKTGLPYADRHLRVLADGEEVISNRRGQADRWRPVLKAINAGMADGGTVESRPIMSGGAFRMPVLPGGSIDYDRLASAMAAIRPMYGDAHFYGDWTQWKRQMDEDRRLSASDGMPR